MVRNAGCRGKACLALKVKRKEKQLTMNTPIVRFEDLIAWQKAQDLAVKVYGTFEALRNFDLRSQICSAAASVSNNIAEGFDSRRTL